MRAVKWIKRVALALVLLIAPAIGIFVWLTNTQSGARWATSVAVNALAGKLAVGSVEGRLIGPLTLTKLRYRDPGAGVDVSADSISIDLAVGELLRAIVHVNSLRLSGVDVALSEPTRPPPPQKQPFSLRPPIDVEVDSLAASTLVVRRNGDLLAEIADATLAGHWTQQDLAIERFDIRATQGELHVAGRVEQRNVYIGEASGRFRWTVGNRTYAGDVHAVAPDENAQISVALSRPIAAKLDGRLTQVQQWPWRFTLEAPRFDPRRELLPGSRFTSAAASLRGEGSLEAGEIRGALLIDDEPLRFDPLSFSRSEGGFSIESVLHIAKSAGELRLAGVVDPQRTPLFASMAANWTDVVLPALWVGQEVHTRGRVDVSGTLEHYEIAGSVSAGPEGRIADLELRLSGSPQQVQLAQLDVVQQPGRLSARGKLDLQPNVAWDLNAKARQFDPGAFAAAWRGELNFDLATTGRITAQGPETAVRVTDLRGRLRGRPISGDADISIAPPLIASGTMNLRSGQSTFQFVGNPGAAIDAMIGFDIASLDDFAPTLKGAATGEFSVRGRWPHLAIDGGARGRNLDAANMRIEALTVNGSVDDLLNPRGSLSLNATKLIAAGLEFGSVQAQASGAPEKHRLEVRATGQPVSMNLSVEGARTKEGWSGSVSELLLDVKDVTRLSLRDPVQIVAARGSVQVSDACFVDSGIQLCAQGEKQSDGAMQARYSLANAPLSLLNVLVTAEPPLQFSGMIQGEGDVRRAPTGELFGQLQIRSPEGHVTRGAAAESETLLSYENLQISANLAGADVRASMDATVAGGTLRGEGELRGLGQGEPSVDARLLADLPDITPFAVFAPQVSNVQGRANARINVGGTLQAMQLSGAVTASNLAADIPAIGVHLRNGEVELRPVSMTRFELSGVVESGGGKAQLSGAADPSGGVDVKITGDRFLIADIPGARVLVTPDLHFSRLHERMRLTGQVTAPEATVNLQKLPRGGRVQAASADVVVIDAAGREREQARPFPLDAQVTLVLGDKVQLSGFGLEAKIDGRLEVRESPGEPATGSGEVRVAGTYKAYGQDLTIRQGQLIYAATPLTNPRLNIEAVRQTDDVTAGLRVRGSAQSPELTVFSNQPISQENALSYLVAGKPLEDIGANPAESNAMQNAAQSLGTAAGGLLTKNLGRRLGVNELSVQQSEQIGGAALTIGQYLSPRLYLSYGVGLFEPGEVVTLRYRLSRKFAVQAQSGPTDTRGGIEYRTER